MKPQERGTMAGKPAVVASTNEEPTAEQPPATQPASKTASAARPTDGVYNIRDFGATGDGKALDTSAINATIAECAKAGGGTVLVPPGEYLSGTIRLESNLTLHLQSGATIKGSTNPADYRLGEMTHSAEPTFHPEQYLRLGLVYAKGLKNVAITGRGTLDGNGDAFMDLDKVHVSSPDDNKYARQGKDYIDRMPDGPVAPKVDANNKRLRPGSMILFDNCANVSIRDVTISNSPNWSLHIAGCRNVDILGCTMHHSLLVPNADCIDVGNSHDVRIANCDLVSGDDCIAIGTCGDDYSHDVTENITVTNCRLVSRSAGIRVGFADYDIRNCVFQNLVITSTNRGIGMFIRGKQSIENVLFSNIVIDTRLHTGWWGHGEPIHLSAIQGRKDPELGQIRDVRFSNILATCETGVVVYGSDNSVIQDVVFDNVKLKIKNSPLNETYGGNFDLRPAQDERLRVFKHDIPAFFGRHIRRCTLRNFEVDWQDTGLPKFFNHAIQCEQFSSLTIDGFKGRQPHTSDPRAAIALNDGNGIHVRDCTAARGTGAFMSLTNVSNQGLFVDNDLYEAAKAFEPAEVNFVMDGNRSRP